MSYLVGGVVDYLYIQKSAAAAAAVFWRKIHPASQAKYTSKYMLSNRPVDTPQQQHKRGRAARERAAKGKRYTRLQSPHILETKKDHVLDTDGCDTIST